MATAQWMFGDVGLGVNMFARHNPLRWSQVKDVRLVIEELEILRDKASTKTIFLRFINDHGVVTKAEFDSVANAILDLRKKTGTWHMTRLCAGAGTRQNKRQLCQFGTCCYRRNPEHLESEAHPADSDYLDCCRAAGVKPVFVSLRKLFDWGDITRRGCITKDELSAIWTSLQMLGDNIGELDDETFKKVDDDGNGLANFGEFADFAVSASVRLPLGLDELLGQNENEVERNLCCGVSSCECRGFIAKRTRCKYGTACHDTAENHLKRFCHPDDSEWENNSEYSSMTMCLCNHKRSLHYSSDVVDAVEYPAYWSERKPRRDSNEPSASSSREGYPSQPDCSSAVRRIDRKPSQILTEDFSRRLSTPELVRTFQELLTATYCDTTTRDRAHHNNGNWMVPRSFDVASVLRNENSRLWRRYTVRKAELRREKKIIEGDPTTAAKLPEYRVYDNVKTTRCWASLSDVDVLDRDINEWYLYHGTSVENAERICKNGFKFQLAGSSTGTLYGRGSYFAESITKADEYSKEEDGSCAVLLCRVLGGRVLYCDEREPDPAKLTAACVAGPFDCILGDREKISKTYREFVFFDTQNIYPEYVITYKRGELFKSPSYPGRH